jgi:protein-arginine kinase activator protein McsA
VTRLCAECGQHPAIYRMTKTGQVTGRKDHDLCQQCARAAVNRLRKGHASGLPHMKHKRR